MLCLFVFDIYCMTSDCGLKIKTAKCLKRAFFLMASRGQLLSLQKHDLGLYMYVYEKNNLQLPPPCACSKHFPNELIDSNNSFMSFLVQRDAYLANEGLI